MRIDLDRPVVERARSNRWVWLVLLGVAAVLIGGAITPRPSAAARSTSVSREIAFQVEGAGRADFAAVWTRTEAIRFVSSASTARYTDPITAVLTVRSANDRAINKVTCRIRVDGVVVDERVAVEGQSATCVWVRYPISQTRSTE